MKELTGKELVKTILWYYFCDSSILLPLLEMIIAHIHEDMYICSYTPIPFEEAPIEMRDFFGDGLYSAFIILYGKYGNDPRCGWIDDLTNFKQLILELINEERVWGLHDVEGIKDNN